ncbi:MAG: hypothetical protein ACLFSJ_03785 [Halorhodospira sp.]
MTEHEAQQLQLLEQLNDLLEKLDPDHLAEAQKRVNRSIEIRKRQAREQALAEAREISRRYGVPLHELAG